MTEPQKCGMLEPRLMSQLWVVAPSHFSAWNTTIPPVCWQLPVGTRSYLWDIRATSRYARQLMGHTKWIRSIRMAGDTLITGSDDWTARIWSASRGTCDAVLACHAGPVQCVEYSPLEKGIITGSSDGMVRFWENADGGIRCVKNLTIHSAPI